MNDWAEDLTPEQEDELLQKAADQIRKRKLEAPAILFLESHKPLSYVGSQAATVYAPFLVPFLGYDFVHNYSKLFAKRENVEKLITLIEQAPPKEATP